MRMGLAPPTTQRGYGVDWDCDPKIGASRRNPLSTHWHPLRWEKPAPEPTPKAEEAQDNGEDKGRDASAAPDAEDDLIISMAGGAELEHSSPVVAAARDLEGSNEAAPTAAQPSPFLLPLERNRRWPPTASPLVSIAGTNAYDQQPPKFPKTKMRSPAAHGTGDALLYSRGFGTHLEDSSSTTTSVFHIEGARQAATSVASSRRMFTTLLPPTPLSDQRPSSSRSHLTGFRGYDGLLSATDDTQTDGEGRISSESAMTILQQEWPYRQKVEAWRSRSRDGPEEVEDVPGPMDVTASMTRQEFEALPPAIQRKYFSILERHRFFQQPSPTISGPPTLDSYNSLDAKLPAAPKRPWELHLEHSTKQRWDRPKRRSSRRASFYLNLPDKIKRQHLTIEEQLVVSKLRSESKKLDPINDALREVREVRQNSKAAKLKHLYIPAPEPFIRPKTMDSHQPSVHGAVPDKKGADSFYDSFRWMEEEKELDLKLYLDDYHANLRQDLPPATESRRPSFRRTLSITKLPFGRSSVSSSRPGTMHAASPVSPALPRYTPTSPTTPPAYYTGRRTRAMSWMSSSKQNQLNQIAAANASLAGSNSQPCTPRIGEWNGKPNERHKYAVKESAAPQLDTVVPVMGDQFQTFLADDDKSSTYSDEGSAAEPESPKTPLGVEKTAIRPLRVEETPFSPKPSGEYLSAPSAREITLRMTLTRPDLRANEDELYGWQRTCQPKRTRTLMEDYDPITCSREGNSKESIERQLAAMDQWHAQVHDRGKMKRLWHKVRGA